MLETVPSPCRSLCNLGRDKVCQGCFRTASEITYWTTYSVEEKQEVVTMARTREREHMDTFGKES